MKSIRIEVKWAVFFIATLLLWMFLERISGLHSKYIHLQQYLTMVFVIPAVLVYVLALKDKMKNFYSGQMNFKQGFISGLIITLIITVFSPLTQWVVSYVITPDYFKNVIEFTLQTGYYKSIEDAQAYFNFKNYAIQSTIWALAMGIVTTLIAAAFVRSKKVR